MKSYQQILQAIRNDGAIEESVAMIDHPASIITDEQADGLRLALAIRIVDEAGEAGGIDEVKRLAEKGWPGLEGPANEAIKKEATHVSQSAASSSVEESRCGHPADNSTGHGTCSDPCHAVSK